MATVRPATPADIPAILGLVRGLADYANASTEVEADEQSFAEALFGTSPAVFAHVIDHDTDGESMIAGCAVWFLNFSTWKGTHGIYLEDLYIRPELRGRGYGTELLKTLATIAVERNYARFEWSVLDWNESSAAFYKSLGAVPQDDSTIFRLSGEALRDLAVEQTSLARISRR